MPLAPGDVLLYWGSGVYNTIIALKTWHKVSHVETYLGNGQSAASRNGIGVGTFPLRLDGLIGVYRPTWRYDAKAALAAHLTMIGEPYDWVSLAAFIGLCEKPDRGKFCSEHAAILANASGGRPFGDEATGKIAPFQFSAVNDYARLWRA